jgi:hypothetical protein
MGVFAARSPQRPNPIALTTSEIIGIELNHILQVLIEWKILKFLVGVKIGQRALKNQDFLTGPAFLIFRLHKNKVSRIINNGETHYLF